MASPFPKKADTNFDDVSEPCCSRPRLRMSCFGQVVLQVAGVHLKSMTRDFDYSPIPESLLEPQLLYECQTQTHSFTKKKPRYVTVRTTVNYDSWVIAKTLKRWNGEQLLRCGTWSCLEDSVSRHSSHSLTKVGFLSLFSFSGKLLARACRILPSVNSCGMLLQDSLE